MRGSTSISWRTWVTNAHGHKIPFSFIGLQYKKLSASFPGSSPWFAEEMRAAKMRKIGYVFLNNFFRASGHFIFVLLVA
jgi:hypothetical protein